MSKLLAWHGPVRVPQDLPELGQYQPGVYIWVRRYTQGGVLCGLVIYVGADCELPKRMFAHLTELLGCGQSMWDVDRRRVSSADVFEVFKSYKNKETFDALMAHARSEFDRSEYFYSCCERGSTLDIEKTIFGQIRSRIESVGNFPIWMVAFCNGASVSTRLDFELTPQFYPWCVSAYTAYAAATYASGEPIFRFLS